MAYIRLRKRNKLRIKNSAFLFKLCVVFIGIIVIGYIFALILFAWYGRALPAPDKLSDSRQNSTVFYDRNDKVIYELYKNKNRVPIKSEEIPDVVKQATVAIEDKHFYKHGGISKMGILRAAIFSMLGNTQGGSTITQQLIKNVLLTSERKLERKIKEAILAYQVEKKYSKDQILTMYLNEAPYGGNYYGVGTASKAYFNKEPKELKLVEAAFLAGLPQQPTRYSPFINSKGAWKSRTKDVLRRMREDKYIDKNTEKKALAQLDKMVFSKQYSDIKAAHFIFFLKDNIEQEFGPGLISKGVKVKTTLDFDLQEKAEKIVRDEIFKLTKFQVGNGALVSIKSNTGEIITYVGSYDFANEEYGKYDVVWKGKRQPGSTLKPIEYALALKKGYTAASLIMDVKTAFPNVTDEDYIPENYDNKYRGPVQMRFTLGNSLNVPAVKMLAMIGVRGFLQQAYSMGISTLEPTDENIKDLGLSASLGGGVTTLLELTQAYSVFANDGNRVEPYGIESIEDFDGNKIYEHKEQSPQSVISKEVSFIVSHILSDNNARLDTFGPNSYLKIPGKTVAVKSGTTNDKRDNWAIGYTKSITLGVWVGNNDNSPMNKAIASGATGASPIWHDTMKVLLSEFDDGIMEKPEGVEAFEIDSFLGGLPKDGYPSRTEYFIKGTVPKTVSPFYQTVKVSKETGKIANEVEIKSGNYEEKQFVIIKESDPISGDGKNRWQEAIDEWARSQQDEKYHYPTDMSQARIEDISVSIINPKNENRIDSNSITLETKIASIEPVAEVKIFLDDTEVKSISGDQEKIQTTIDVTNGKHKIKVTARNSKDKSSSTEVNFSVNENY